MDGVNNSIDSNTETMFGHAQSVLHMDIYSYNQELYEGYQWIAALDSHTCLACAELDNKIFRQLPDQKVEPPTPPEPIPIEDTLIIEDFTEDEIYELIAAGEPEMFNRLSLEEAQALKIQLKSIANKDNRFDYMQEQLSRVIPKLERSENYLNYLREHGIDIPKSNIKIEIGTGVYDKIMDEKDTTNWGKEYLAQFNEERAGLPWGRAEPSNEKALAFMMVNGGEYHPVERNTNNMQEFKGGSIRNYTFIDAIQQRNYARAHVGNVTVKELLRGENRAIDWIENLKPGSSIPLTGISAFTANNEHNNEWMNILDNRITSGDNFAPIRYHLSMTDDIRKRTGMLQLDDLDQGITDWSQPSELLLSGQSFIVDRIEPGTGVAAYDIWITIK